MNSLCLQSQPTPPFAPNVEPMKKMEMRHDHLPARPFAFLALHQDLLRSRKPPAFPRRQAGKAKRSGAPGYRAGALSARLRDCETILDAVIGVVRNKLRTGATRSLHPRFFTR